MAVAAPGEELGVRAVHPIVDVWSGGQYRHLTTRSSEPPEAIEDGLDIVQALTCSLPHRVDDFGGAGDQQLEQTHLRFPIT